MNKSPEPITYDFRGFRLELNNEQILCQTERHYLSKLEDLDQDIYFKQFRSIWMRLAWLSTQDQIVNNKIPGSQK